MVLWCSDLTNPRICRSYIAGDGTLCGDRKVSNKLKLNTGVTKKRKIEDTKVVIRSGNFEAAQTTQWIK
jgi:hypothetical protein